MVLKQLSKDILLKRLETSNNTIETVKNAFQRSCFGEKINSLHNQIQMLLKVLRMTQRK